MKSQKVWRLDLSHRNRCRWSKVWLKPELAPMESNPVYSRQVMTLLLNDESSSYKVEFRFYPPYNMNQISSDYYSPQDFGGRLGSFTTDIVPDHSKIKNDGEGFAENEDVCVYFKEHAGYGWRNVQQVAGAVESEVKMAAAELFKAYWLVGATYDHRLRRVHLRTILADDCWQYAPRLGYQHCAFAQ